MISLAQQQDMCSPMGQILPLADTKAKSTYPFGKCKVCSDRATGIHYGIASCEGCKGFFKRSTLRKEKYRCYFGNDCPLTPDSRNRCKACRYRKCCEAGMSVQGAKMGRIPKAEKEKALKCADQAENLHKGLANYGHIGQKLSIEHPLINLIKFHTPFKNSKIVANLNHSSALDDTYHIIASLLSDKIYQIYVVHNEPVEKLLDRASHLINSQVSLFDGWNANLKQVWDGLLESIPAQVKNLITMCKEIPGLNELCQNDLTNLVNNRLFDYFLIKHSPLFINGESYLMLPNMIQYTRKWMLRIIGAEMVDIIFKFAHEFNSLKMTTKEMALLYPFVLTIPDDNYQDPCTISSLNEYYYRTLLYEFDLNKRDGSFLSKWKALVSKLPEISETQMKNIGGLRPETGTVDNSHLVENSSFNNLIDNLRNLENSTF
uniref:Nuclear receptor n=1 Tax=Brachionus rotundiformis TaxID=96890 RepID=A0A221CAW7_9BILA|nr:nuclear receptor [Brachionus rotundiformis]